MSVVVPLYNKRETVTASLESVLCQTLQDFEIIVVDDGSTDGSGSIARQLGDPRIRVISQANKGVSVARNRGIAECRAELIAFLDADDEWLPEYLATMTELARRFPDAGLYAAGVRRVSRDGSYVDRFATLAGEFGLIDYFAAPEEGGLVAPSWAAVTKSVVNTIGGFLEGEPAGEDLELWARIALRYDVACTARVLVKYRIDEEGRVRQRLRLKPPYPPHVRTLRALLATGAVGACQAANVKLYVDWHAMFFVHGLLELNAASAKQHLLGERFYTFPYRLEGFLLRAAVRILPARAVWSLRWRPVHLFWKLRGLFAAGPIRKVGRRVTDHEVGAPRG